MVLLGPSGSGKSTLLNILGGLDVPTAGQVAYRDHDLTGADERELTRYRREHVGFVFQFYNLIPSLTARENVALVTEIAEHPLAAEEALALVGLGERLDHFPAQLSGGEQQRVAIARAIAKRPDAAAVRRAHRRAGRGDRRAGARGPSQRVNRELGTTTAHHHPQRGHRRAWRTGCSRLADGRLRREERNAQPASAGGAHLVSALTGSCCATCAQLRGQALTIALVVACGIASYVTSVATYRSLEHSQRGLLRALPLRGRVRPLRARARVGCSPRLRALPGVAQVETRVVEDVLLDLPDLTEPAMGRLVSIPERRSPRSTGCTCASGRLPEPGRTRRGAGERGLRDGARAAPGRARARGAQRAASARSRSWGWALSPEYVYAVRPGRPAARRPALRRLLDAPARRWPRPSAWRGPSTTWC